MARVEVGEGWTDCSADGAALGDGDVCSQDGTESQRPVTMTGVSSSADVGPAGRTPASMTAAMTNNLASLT